MSFIDGIAELFKGKKQEPVASSPQVPLEQKRQDLASLEAMVAQGGRDYRNPADANRIKELRNQIAAIKSRESQKAETPQTS